MTTESEADWEEFGNPEYEHIYGADYMEFSNEQDEIALHQENLSRWIHGIK